MLEHFFWKKNYQANTVNCKDMNDHNDAKGGGGGREGSPHLKCCHAFKPQTL